jgi:hypothetical protein
LKLSLSVGQRKTNFFIEHPIRVGCTPVSLKRHLQ